MTFTILAITEMLLSGHAARFIAFFLFWLTSDDLIAQNASTKPCEETS